MMRNPDISVILAVYNSERYILESVDSILNQTFETYEFIIIDDGSTDGTSDLLETVDDPRVIVRRREHHGLTAQLNQALAMARAPIIARMDSGDIAAPDRLRMQYEYLSDAAVGVVSCSYDVIDEEGRTLGTRWLPETDAEIRYHLPIFSTICHAGACYRKDLVMGAGGYDARDYPVAQDLDLWLRLLPMTQFRNLREPLQSCRSLPTSISGAAGARQRSVHLRLGLRYLDAELAQAKSDVERREIFLRMARCHYYNGSMRDARNILRPLLSSYPRKIPIIRYWIPSLLGDRMMRHLRASGVTERGTRFLKRKKVSWRYFSP